MRLIGTLLYSLISAVLAAVAVQYLVGNWNEEYLNYSLGEPRQISRHLWYQEIELRNDGVDPATNVKVYVKPFKNGEIPKVESEFDLPGNGKSIVGGFERVRRREVISLSITFSGETLSPSQIQFKSDRSIAEFGEKAPWPFWPWSWWPGIGTFLFVYIFLAIAIPARKDYLAAARRAKEKEGHKQEIGNQSSHKPDTN